MRLPNYVYLYFFCQSINLTVAVISLAIAAVVGNSIAADPLYATLPYGLQFLFLLIGTYPASMLMKKYGRKPGFVLGASFLLLAGIIGYFAVTENSFVLLIAAHAFIGLFTACANFYRYAVTDGLVQSQQSKALSLVVAGGIIAGIIGPTISSQLQDVAGFSPFSLCYAVFILLAVINLLMIRLLPKPHDALSEQPKNTAVSNITQYNPILISIIIAAFGYGLMNLFMIQSTLKMDHMYIPFEDVAFAIQWHVVFMFLPSFFTGILIAKYTHKTIITVGLILFIISAIINIQMPSYSGMTIALILLGLGWNFTYIGGSTLLTFFLSNNPDKQKWQGIGETTIAIFATIGAMSPSFLFSAIGWANSNIISVILCIVALILVMFLNTQQKHEVEIN